MVSVMFVSLMTVKTIIPPLLHRMFFFFFAKQIFFTWYVASKGSLCSSISNSGLAERLKVTSTKSACSFYRLRFRFLFQRKSCLLRREILF